MAYEQRDGSGVLFPNDKGGNPKRPDYRGNCTLNGEPFRISAWRKQGAKGEFLSLAFDPAEQPEPGANGPIDTGAATRQGILRQPKRQMQAAPDNDEIPF